MRLAFAVAAHLEPEILIVDEVLAVGDYEFQKKCLGKIEEVARGGGGRTILFVSHNMGMVRSLCSRCVYLKAGQVVAQGDPEVLIDLYEQNSTSDGQNGYFRQQPDDRYALQVLEAELCNAHDQRQTSAIDQFSPLSLRLRYVVHRPLVGCNLGVWLTYRSSKLFLVFDTDEDPDLVQMRQPGRYEAILHLPTDVLKAGTYTIGLDSGIINQAKRPDHQQFENLITFEIREAFDTSLKGYSPNRGGAIAIRSNWETRRLGPTMEDPLETTTTQGKTA